ncbi:hypothetical protein IVA80_23560 [Bradyrhizobium sp. 139]|uniref:hypothetical protein n=1 Tax=Bradyrhizobium sp. 139 TaxID=2782616 RepID=UPI001FF9513A|nr:hypothetical protein [Bradyrhizobium sp. 139]MCK1743744.1 hypothetical protein [Bradyrhizobium sp. 139]
MIDLTAFPAPDDVANVFEVLNMALLQMEMTRGGFVVSETFRRFLDCSTVRREQCPIRPSFPPQTAQLVASGETNVVDRAQLCGFRGYDGEKPSRFLNQDKREQAGAEKRDAGSGQGQ